MYLHGIFIYELYFVPLASFGPTLGSLWLPLGALGLPLGILWDPFGRPGAYGAWLKPKIIGERGCNLMTQPMIIDERGVQMSLKFDLHIDVHILGKSLVLQPKTSFLEFIC